MVEKYNKVTVGFVTQYYQLDKQGNFVCADQEFTCGDEVVRENYAGEPVDILAAKEKYFPYHMVQPAIAYYLLFVWGCVQPETIGPFDTAGERDKKALELREKEGDEHGYYPFELPVSINIDIDTYSGAFFDGEDELEEFPMKYKCPKCGDQSNTQHLMCQKCKVSLEPNPDFKKDENV